MSRKFISPGSARIDIPGGIPYDSIDWKDATMINPVNLAGIFDCCSGITFYNYPFANEPNKSLVDIEDLMRDNDMYTATFQMDIDKTLYQQSSPIFPLYVDQKVGYIGRSSIKIKSTLNHEELAKPYAICNVQYVYIDPKRRASKEFPVDWKEKYQRYCKDGTPLTMSKLTKPEVTNEYSVTVRPSDTDFYGHTNFASYIKFCTDALFSGVSNSVYKHIGQYHLHGGLKSLIIAYRKESLFGSTLTIHSWEDKLQKDTVHFEHRNGDDICCQATLQYYVKGSQL
ncbi:hypothetical protein ScPMuIL_012225 [Solemya velum]